MQEEQQKSPEIKDADQPKFEDGEKLPTHFGGVELETEEVTNEMDGGAIGDPSDNNQQEFNN